MYPHNFMNLAKDVKILSIQSHVITGSVGNNAAVFPVQSLGMNIDKIDTVNYGSTFIHEGKVTDTNELLTLLHAIMKSEIRPVLDHPGQNVGSLESLLSMEPTYDLSQYSCRTGGSYTHILTGYISNPQNLSIIIDYILGLKMYYWNSVSVAPLDTSNTKSSYNVPALRPLWLCDTVLGDNNKMYVHPQLLDIYVEKALPIADIITPNHFEAGWLTNMNVSMDNVWECCDRLHLLGPPVVIITSVPKTLGFNNKIYFCISYDKSKPFCNATRYRAYESSNCCENDNNYHAAVKANSPVPYRDFVLRRYIEIDEIPTDGPYYGTGDLTAALILANIITYKELDIACEKTVGSLQAVIRKTMNSNMQYHLDIVGCRHLYENPPFVYSSSDANIK